jgi:hypothetical protein
MSFSHINYRHERPGLDYHPFVCRGMVGWFGNQCNISLYLEIQMNEWKHEGNKQHLSRILHEQLYVSLLEVSIFCIVGIIRVEIPCKIIRGRIIS